MTQSQKERVAYLFAGQGAQYVGMGHDLYERFPASRRIFEQADEALGDISRLCFEGPAEELTRTDNAQPAILTVSIAALEAFRSSISEAEGYACAYVAGLSLGEYGALVVSGALSFRDAVQLVRRRGQFMEEEAHKHPGGMLSVIGLDREAAEKICREMQAEIANLNCPGQIVLSASSLRLNEVRRAAEAAGAKRVIPLEVSGAFHSSLMKGASVRLAHEMEKIVFNEPSVAVVSNVTGTTASSSIQIRENLILQVASSVRWEDSMRFIIAQGVRTFFEFGPGKVLKGFLRRIDPAVTVTSIEKKADIEAFQSGGL